MIGNLTEVRGGCIIFIDYSYYGKDPNFLALLWHFDSISSVVTKLLKNIEKEGFSPDNWFMFGQSYGARLVIDAAANFGYQKVKEIDGIEYSQHMESSEHIFTVCELAGPGFEFRFTTKSPQSAAKNVACIHTSVLAGTFIRDCHQDW